MAPSIKISPFLLSLSIPPPTQPSPSLISPPFPHVPSLLLDLKTFLDPHILSCISKHLLFKPFIYLNTVYLRSYTVIAFVSLSLA